ncbi:uncharacterized protein LOC126836002 isoform X2 [Adelges cooleyi]|uniref:uncharacterized protein LOC126836002 isoform X2 n=1 Tax=Adelges cooleyi TaxID=133065 RepID=UPI0021803FF3|nr:uncharacterized protein LOC126836002 isoform X2 [Adelges cooleyi]
MIEENAKIRYESQKTKNLTKLLENRRIGHTEELKNRIAHESTGFFLELRRLANDRRPTIERAVKKIIAEKLAGNVAPIYMSSPICLLIALWISSNTASKTPTKFDGDNCIIGYKKYHFVKYRSIDGKLWQVNRLDVPIKELNVQLYEENFIYNILEEY